MSGYLSNDIFVRRSLIYTIVSLNPLTIIMNMFRDLVIYGVMPSIGSFVAAIGISGIVLAIGLYVFYKKQDTFILICKNIK